MNKLTHMEAQRVIAVLEDTLERLNLLSYVPPSIQSDMTEALTEAGLNPIKSSLNQHLNLEERVRSWNERDKEKEGSLPDIFLNPNERNMASKVPEVSSETIAQMHSSTRALVRTLRKNPVATEIFYSLNEERSSGFLQTITYLTELKDIMYRRLSTTVEEEASTRALLQELSAKEQSAEDEREALREVLRKQRAEKEREVAQLDAQLGRLRAELTELAAATKAETEEIREALGEALGAAGRDHEAAATALGAEADALEREIEKLAEEHREVEATLRKKKAKAEADLTAAIGGYDEAMAAKTQAIEQLSAQAQDEAATLKELQEHFDKIDANNAQRDEEERLLARCRKREAQAEYALFRAAADIQKLLRGIQRREVFKKDMAKKRKKGKGKKGKGKKGKKK